MRVYIIGAGPGDPGLITVRGAELIARCPVVFYTGSLVPKEIVARANERATVLDSSSMTLEQIVAVLVDARDRDLDVARVHTGDPTIFGSTAEQMRRMEELGIEYEIVPGVSSFTAAAAALGRELTLPELSQTVILTRAEGRTPMPAREKLEELAAHQATLCLFLSITLLRDVVAALIPAYGADCPVAIVHRGELARSSHRARHLGGHSGSGARGGPQITVHDLGRARADRDGLRKFEALRSGIYSPLSSRRKIGEGGSFVNSEVLLGKTIIVARARPGLSKIARRLRDLGATVLELPHFAAGAATRIALAASELRESDIALLSSVGAVEAWLDSSLALPLLALGSEVAALLQAANRRAGPHPARRVPRGSE